VNAGTTAAGAAQIAGGILLAPLLPGLIQHWKARLQGRRGPSPLQPYRELRRLWGKSAISVEGTSAVYRLAPAVVAASLVAAVLLVPAAERAPNWGVGHDALALAGFLALARFALAASAWDVANGFSLMGASRDLTLSVFVEATLILSLAVAALVAATTDLTGIIAGTAGTAVWSSPALGLGAVAFALVVVAETGRQPVDNPDTHLELTMIHEVMVLDHGGPLLGVIMYGAATKLFVFAALLVRIVIPLDHPAWLVWAAFLAGLVAVAIAIGVIESTMARLRLPHVPALLLSGCLFCALAIVLLVR